MLFLLSLVYSLLYVFFGGVSSGLRSSFSSFRLPHYTHVECSTDETPKANVELSLAHYPSMLRQSLRFNILGSGKM